MLPVGFHVHCSDFRPLPDPEPTGSSWICREQRVVLLLLLVVVVVVVVQLLVPLLVVVLGVASRFSRPFHRVPAKSGPRADRI